MRSTRGRGRTKGWRAACVAAALVLAHGAAPAGWLDGFKDPDDGRLDLSEWLLERRGVLPVPIIITEPAVGYGGGLGGLFFRRAEREGVTGPGGARTPPDVYAIGAAGTENGTKGAAAGGMVSFDQDRYRWRGGIARVSMNLDFFGAGGDRAPLAYNLDGWGSVQQAMMRLGSSDAWLVGRWNYVDLSNSFRSEGDSRIGSLGRASRVSGLGLSLEQDSRDNIFTPSRGWKGALELTWYDPNWGSDTQFQTYRAHAFGYWPVGKSVVLGARAELRSAEGRVPFYMLPYVDLRGVPALRLQDRHTSAVEAEARWNLDARWALVGFVGAGRAWGSDGGTDTISKGAGFRYLVARRLGLYVGIDWAWSTQDRAWYLQVGSAWR